MTRSCFVALAALLLVACDDAAPPALVAGESDSWEEADRLFRQEPRWLGGDGAYSCALGGDRIAWFFGDSFVATSELHLRSESKMVRNTVAVQTGASPVTATMSFAWGTTGDGAPTAFFPDVGDRWHWPGACVRLPGGPLAVFLMVERPSDEGLGFAGDGWRVAFIDNPDDEPTAWRFTYADPPPQTFDATVGVAAALVDQHVVLLSTGDGDAHVGRTARITVTDLSARKLDALEWWTGNAWAIGGTPSIVLSEAGSEASLHVVDGEWVHIASRGFGGSTVAMRTAPEVTGPWSSSLDVFTPPESLGPDPFVYAAKAHPELGTDDGELAITYVANSFRFEDLLTVEGTRTLYWPRFARVRLAPR